MNVENEKQFVPYLILEEYFKKKYLPDIKAINEFINYISSYFAVKKDKIKYNSNYNYICFEIPRETVIDHYKIVVYDNGRIESNICIYEYGRWREAGRDFKLTSFEKSKKTKDFLENFIIPYLNKPRLSHLDGYKLSTNNNDFLVDIEIYELHNINLSIYNPYSWYGLYDKFINANEETQKLGKERKPIFFDPFPDKNKREFTEEEIAKINYAKEKEYTEEEIGKILVSIKVDISKYSNEQQEEIKQFYISSMGKLSEEEEKRISDFRQLQIDRIMLAYQKFKEIAELLNDTKMDLKFDKVKIDNLRSIIFKNNGYPTENGYIEFDDFFKNNMILRMLDLSQLDLTNVNITYMDFSGTNIHINPQTIYNKDMTGVNAIGVHFSPFSDNFDDVILDGALINDYEAMIDYNKLRSYESNTIIKKEVVAKIMK